MRGLHGRITSVDCVVSGAMILAALMSVVTLESGLTSTDEAPLDMASLSPSITGRARPTLPPPMPLTKPIMTHAADRAEERQMDDFRQERVVCVVNMMTSSSS